MKIILLRLLIGFLVYICIFSIIGFQIARFDTHIENEATRSLMLILKGFMSISSFFALVFIFIKKEKLVIVCVTVLLTIILNNILESHYKPEFPCYQAPVNIPKLSLVTQAPAW